MAVELRAEPEFKDVLHVCMNMRERDRAEIYATRWEDDPLKVARDVCMSGAFRWGVYLDGQPVGLIGAQPRWPNVWTCWAFGTDDWLKAIASVTRHVRRFMLPALLNAGAHRVDCLALESHKQSCRWLEYLGAIPEKKLDFWGKNGETFVSYVWTREATKRVMADARLTPDDQ